MRSRASILPFECWRSTARSLPALRAASRRSLSSSSLARIMLTEATLVGRPTPRVGRAQGVVVSGVVVSPVPSAAIVVGTMVDPVVPTMLVGTAGRVVDEVGVEPSAS